MELVIVPYSLVAQPHNTQKVQGVPLKQGPFWGKCDTGSNQSKIGDLVKWNFFINGDIVMLMTFTCSSIGTCSTLEP